MKKLVLFVVGLVTVLFLAVLAAGLTTETVEYQNRVLIARPPEEVWVGFTDPSRMKEWMGSLDTIENLSGGQLEVGSRWRLTFDGDELLETVTAVEPPRRYAFDMRTDVFTGDTEVRLAPRGSGTELTSSTRVVGDNVLLQGLFVFMKSSFVRRTQEDYERLRDRIEGSK